MSTELDVTKKSELHEQLSALADGELAGEKYGACLAAMGKDDAVMARWADYQRMGDVMRSGSALAGQGNELAFVAAFRERLAAETAVQSVSANVVPFPQHEVAAPVGQQKKSLGHERTAANDGVYRWKMVAGLASVMAVLVVGWTALDDFSFSSTPTATETLAVQEQTQPLSQPAATATIATASTAPSGGQVVPVSVQEQAAVGSSAAPRSAVALLPQGTHGISQPGLVIGRDSVDVGSSRYALQAANDDMAAVMIRDPRLDEFLAAHRQGNASVLQAPVDYVRDAAVQSAP